MIYATRCPTCSVHPSRCKCLTKPLPPSSLRDRTIKSRTFLLPVLWRVVNYKVQSNRVTVEDREGRTSTVTVTEINEGIRDGYLEVV